MIGRALAAAGLVLCACGYQTGDCMLQSECEPCVQQAGCTFCLETNECTQGDTFCPGDRATQVADCDEAAAKHTGADAGPQPRDWD